jgi:hypothetical protein
MDPVVDVTEQKRLNEARTVMPGTIARMTRRAHAPTGGVRTGSAASATTGNGCVLR